MGAILFDILCFRRSLNVFPVELQKSPWIPEVGSEEALASFL